MQRCYSSRYEIERIVGDMRRRGLKLHPLEITTTANGIGTHKTQLGRLTATTLII